MSTDTPPRTSGIHHAGLTVPDLAAARTFFQEALGSRPVGAVPFDRRRVIGLHHFALRVADAEALQSLHEELAARTDTRVEFAPERLGGGPARHMMCRMPGDIRLELIAPAAA